MVLNSISINVNITILFLKFSYEKNILRFSFFLNSELKYNSYKYITTVTYLMVIFYWLSRSLPNHGSYLVVMNFGSETETVILSNVIQNLKKKLYVYLSSENSEYSGGYVYN